MNSLIKQVFIFLLFFNSLNGYQLEDKLQVIITGKIAKFISWGDNTSKTLDITVFNNKFGTYFDDLYQDKKIKGKNVVINYIDKIEQIKDTHILYICDSDFNTLNNIFNHTKNKKIVTISDIRGFAQKGGMVQIYQKNQKLKLKINLNIVNQKNIKIKSSLLRIVDIVGDNK